MSPLPQHGLSEEQVVAALVALGEDATITRVAQLQAYLQRHPQPYPQAAATAVVEAVDAARRALDAGGTSSADVQGASREPAGDARPGFIGEILRRLAALPAASQLVVFGSVARGAASPGDVDVALVLPGSPAWPQIVEAHGPTVRGLLGLARAHYGALDTFVLAGEALYVRNAEATGWTRARQARVLATAIRHEGRALPAVVQAWDTADGRGVAARCDIRCGSGGDAPAPGL